ncbi:MAG: hypothetical protein LBN42_00250 [Oscillospiraceae bacterium]|jgi:virulence-associated protein VapD|nr:hypothetical protein [Oscillospiraceae bacterium]
MSILQAHYKAFNFDLDTKLLKENGFKNTAPAYSAIKLILLDFGFEHRQYSGYVSKKRLDINDVGRVMDALNSRLPWLCRVVQKFDVTNVEGQYDLTDVFETARAAQLAAQPTPKPN